MNDPLAERPQPLSLISTIRVPNVFPTTQAAYRLAIIGEAPGADEEAQGVPFIGASGRLLDNLLAQVGVARSACFVGNVCKYRPPGNDIEEFGYSHEKVQEGVAELRKELEEFKPNCCLLLGNTPLHFAANLSGVSTWRGSILSTSWGKAVIAEHPAYILREYKNWILLRHDLNRGREESYSTELILPQRNLELNLSANEICHRLDNWPTAKLLSFDIEGGLDAFPCCSVAGESNSGFIVAWSRHSEEDQGRISVALSRLLYRADVPKVLQNSLYDRFVLAYGYRMLIRNVVEDTMLKQWEIYPELPKGLGTIASIWTREPAYKYERKTQDQDTFYRYCIKDSCITLEACLAQDNALSGDGRRHYQFNVDLLNPLLYMELRGIKYNKVLANSELLQVKSALNETATRLELRAGYSLLGAKGSISSTKLKRCLYSEKSYPEQKKGRGPTAKVSTDVEALLNLQRKFPQDAFLSDILLHRKLESIKETLEVSTDRDGRVRCGYNLVGTETGRLTCYTSPTGSGANLQTITKKLRKLYVADEGHWLFQCDLAGADGWTVAARCLQFSDPTMWDDYTAGLKPAKIICVMKRYGAEINMLSRDDLKSLCDRESAPGGLCDQDSWEYFGCKRVQHMTNYAGQAKTGVKQIMIDSYKITGHAFYMAESEFETLQRLYFLRYPGLYQWHRWAKQQVAEGKNLISASGHERKFFGRRRSYDHKTRSWDADHETWKEFLADEPQENTTYATNLALHKLWHDPLNRRSPSSNQEFNSFFQRGQHSQDHGCLVIEPLHQVHDALIGQFPKSRTDWTIERIRSYFSNSLLIAGTQVTIPFEGAYGPSWGELGYDNHLPKDDPNYKVWGGGRI